MKKRLTVDLTGSPAFDADKFARLCGDTFGAAPTVSRRENEVRFTFPRAPRDDDTLLAAAEGLLKRAASSPLPPLRCDETEEADGAETEAENLIGAAEFKALLRELRQVSGRINADGTQEVFSYLNYLFAVGDGCGLSTYLRLFARTVEETGLFRLSPFRPVEEVRLLPPDSPSADPFAPVLALLRGNGEQGGKVICIDVREWMTALDDERFRRFLFLLEDRSEEYLFVFRIPFVEQNVADQVSAALQDILYVRTVSFPPLTEEELTEYAGRTLRRLGFSAVPDAWDVFRARVTEEKSNGRFYGMNTADKIVREMIYRKQLHDVKAGGGDKIIRAEEISALAKTYGAAPADPMELLDRMVGMEHVRESLREIVAQIKLARSDPRRDPPCIHMRFIGNPGTGKTSVARIVGKVLKEEGVLRSGGFFEYSGRDLCGRYVGETAPRTAGICRDAYGSVLFIDEAYALFRGDRESRDFGVEALETLIAEMENHRDDLVVIMAGYPEEMQRLMQSNPGLESRMPYVLEFPNYTGEQLCEIFFRMAKDAPCDDGFRAAVKEYFASLSPDVLSSREFSNARFVRNLYERTCAKAAARRTSPDQPLLLTREDFDLAGSDRAFRALTEKKAKVRIGF